MATKPTEVFSGEAAENYASEFANLSGGYVTSIFSIVEGGLAKHVDDIEKMGGHASILEVGGGSGRSAWAIASGLQQQHDLSNFTIYSTEPNRSQINGGISSQASGDNQLHIPEVQSNAQNLPFPRNRFDAVVGSQVLHWVPESDVLHSFDEAFRVLKPGGILVHAISGIVDLGEELNSHHFTRHPFTRFYLNNLENQLVSGVYWDRQKLGEFVPWNPSAHDYYHRLTLAGLLDRLFKAGFYNVETSRYMFPCNTKEMEMRLTGLAAINMHFFGGQFAERIPDMERQSMAARAFTETQRQYPHLWGLFDRQSNMNIHIGPERGTIGEPVPVIIARKSK